MKTKTIAEVTVMLQNTANQVGAKRYEVAKALVLNDLIIVDADGNPVDPSTINYEVTLSAGDAPAAEAEAVVEAAATPKSVAVEVAKAVRTELAITRSENTTQRKAVIVTSPKIYGKLKGFATVDEAFRFGSWAMACLGHKKSAEFCANNGILVKAANTEGSNLTGGFLVPDEMENSIITLRETFGVARQHCKIVAMGSDTRKMPRRSTYMTAAFVGEAATGTQSNDTFDMVTLTAKKSAVIAKVSNELLEDSVVSFGDDLAVSMAYAQSKLEDQSLFIGDATSTYGGINGLANAVGSAGVSTATSTAFSGITLAQIMAAFALLPQYADNANTKIFCHKAVWNSVFLRLAAVAAGNTQTDLLSGDKQLSFLGYPVVLSQAMNSTTGNGSIACHIGDLSQGVYLGDRRQTSVDFSNSALNAFEQDMLVYRATTRWDLICANVGDATNAGSVVTLKAGAS